MGYSYTFQNDELTVSELIHALKQYDENLLVFIEGKTLSRLHDKSGEEVMFEFNLE